MTDAALVNRMQLPRPDITPEEAAELLLTHYGLSGTLTELGSQQDRNYRISAGDNSYVLKICQTEYDTVELEAQNAAIRHLHAKPEAPRLPNIVPSLNGRDILVVTIREQDYLARLLSYLPGQSLTRRKHLPLASVSALGTLSARLARDLADFDHPGLHRNLQWDLRRAGPVAVQLLSAITDHEARDRIAKAMVAAVKRIQPLAGGLRVQPVHHDVTDDNVVCHPDTHGQPIPDGVIDFGDIIQGWLVGDLAVTCASLLHHAEGDPFAILPAIKAYHAVYPLEEVEAKALWPLIVARAVILTASTEQQLAIDPDNDYVRGNLKHEREIFDVATGADPDVMEAAILRTIGFDIAPIDTDGWAALLPDIAPDTIAAIDLSTTSPHFTDGNWRKPDMDWRLLAKEAVASGTAATRYGEFRLSRGELLSMTPPQNFALHSDVCLPAGTTVAAPFAGRIQWDGQHLVLVSDAVSLHLDGIDCTLEEGAEIEQGATIGTIAGEGSTVGGLRVQLCRSPSLVPPLFAVAHQADGWSAVCPSPAVLLSPACEAPREDGATLLARREAHFAGPQKHYYETPPQIERGWREFLFDVEGRAYLDMVNNVTMLGHAHPRLTAAVEQQWSRLNTNSRFHYAAVTEFSERLAALAPEGLDSVFLVNSGSEANDLAIRLAWAHTGKKNMLCLLEAYHGWTLASDAVSTSVADNPQALTTRPDWVHPVVSPNTYRGPFRGPDSGADYVAGVTTPLETIDEKGDGLAGFIAEPVYGNAGGIALPRGYLTDVYAAVRQRGGLCVADEVQVGYGRLGHHFWGFEQQGVVPDIITIAKGMGNGHPLGAVITRKEIAASLEKEGYFFSSAGGSPVSSVVGLTVLDIIRDEGLQENAHVVGDHLKAGLIALMEHFPLIGAVHGTGLYLGVEFVRNRETLTPATEETADICDRLLDLGVIMQPTGDHLNVLKIKPPLCLSSESADFFVKALEKALEDTV
ncbi:aminotransferase [Rhizobium rhizogenes]|uniref:Aminotransferase n=1 Tax=Rhizobium rhizogenes NBRC 13257 TaxID=1220581 RepID=A0AA87Q7G4_RHIRH|nr:aminotransferase [Rhizobium rhizogenes]KAA6487154.1 aminotransferase [Agrobacterium sp. ICMP 7243]NTF46909.1 aminotransferase [Rhizobium rhizogenes]NTF60079.1 aminotransferase [Rhizobium rhizogenes]NTF92256.1 aminotransferase [Rhizobium rhizogenes]NTF98726.1 aminotransferase [Rhizobium rhizogenes]